MYTKICEYCETKFDTFDPKAKFCSKSCYRQSQQEVRTCPHCKNTFTIYRSKRQVYCSSDCLKKSQIIEKVCLYCSKKFTHRASRPRKYCNRECRYADSSRTKPKVFVVCQNCDKPLDYSDGKTHKKYCSKKCFFEHRSSKSKSYKTTSTCKVCNKEFIHYTYRKRVYCSKSCADKSHKTQHKTYICKNCGKSFVDREKIKRVVCSRKCKSEYISHNLKKTCETCGTVFDIQPSQQHKRYCSFSCYIHNSVEMTSLEQIIATTLDNLDIDYDFQYPIGSYFADFLVGDNIIVECDGYICCSIMHNHCEHTAEKDKKRQEFIEKQGFTVIRFNEEELTCKLDESIKNKLLSLILP